MQKLTNLPALAQPAVTPSACIDHGRHGNKQGYCSAYFQRRTTSLHRRVYLEAHGLSLEDAEGQVVRHVCDNPRCINPEHLLLGSHGQNLDDAYERKRRVATGENNGRAVVTVAQVAALRSGAFTREDFVQVTGVSNRHAGQILLGNKWKS